ncbi:MAG: DNA-binding protein [Micavibrio aeruginosavorus]|uniref:DNA-binding protein n=1 Tax=Micavibrio aeruginosavorus TaxID=349221 RepID=A0A2W5N5C5_9BACT|nr:MAG: DNA-binding protein [Micavibrio aeruginosavorus]
MLTHENIWSAIDRLAATFGYSTSGLAKQAGLDATSFNKSKRFSSDGKPRWPSTESISRVLEATGATMSDFLSMMDAEAEISPRSSRSNFIPVIGFAQAGARGYFDEDGYPAGDSWNEVQFPDSEKNEAATYALEISGDSMEPLYRKGDVLVLSRDATIRRGDRVVVRTAKGEVMAKELVRKTAAKIELKSLNSSHENRTLSSGDVSWMARILWVSQ